VWVCPHRLCGSHYATWIDLIIGGPEISSVLFPPPHFWLCYVVSGSHLLGIDHHLYTHMVTSWWMNLGYWLGNPEFGNFVQTFFYFYFFGSAHTHTHTHTPGGERDDGWWFGFGTVFLFFSFFSPLTPHHPFRFFWALLGTFSGRTPNQTENTNSTRSSFFCLVSSESGWALLSTLWNLNGRYHADPAPI
jgi:hypothetical protein